MIGIDSRKRMLDIIVKLQVKATETKSSVDIEKLYYLAAQLARAQCSDDGRSYERRSTEIQGIFADHFCFLVNHSIDLLGLDTT